MINKETLVKVTNRSNSIVGYTIPELQVKRRFYNGETKELTAGELRALAWTKGGKVLIENHLIIDNEALVNELIYNVQPEYFYSKEDIQQLLLMGSEDQLLDALDFGGAGVSDLIKDLAVSLELNDVRKREIIQTKTGFNVTNAIELNRMSQTAPVSVARERRAAPITESISEASEMPQRRAAAPKYSVKVKAE